MAGGRSAAVQQVGDSQEAESAGEADVHDRIHTFVLLQVFDFHDHAGVHQHDHILKVRLGQLQHSLFVGGQRQGALAAGYALVNAHRSREVVASLGTGTGEHHDRRVGVFLKGILVVFRRAAAHFLSGLGVGVGVRLGRSVRRGEPGRAQAVDRGFSAPALALAGDHAAHGLIDRGHGRVHLEALLREGVHQVHLIRGGDGGTHHAAQEGILAAHAEEGHLRAGSHGKRAVVLQQNGAFLADLFADSPVGFHQVVGIGVIGIVAAVIDGLAAGGAQVLVDDAAPLLGHAAHAEHQQGQGQKQGRETAPNLGCFLTHDNIILSNVYSVRPRFG